jgi:hypothetical protein
MRISKKRIISSFQVKNKKHYNKEVKMCWYWMNLKKITNLKIKVGVDATINM